MSNLIVDKPNVKTLFHFGQYHCIQDGESYAVFIIDRASGRQELYGQPSLTLHRAWRQFWDAVDMAMQRRIEKVEANPATGIWADPDVEGKYITNISSPIIREEYTTRYQRDNGRADLPLNEDQRLCFEVDMLNKYSPKTPVPIGLQWRVRTLLIQMQGKNEQKETHP